MRLELKLLIVSTLLVFPVVANGQLRPAKCDVQPLWVGREVRSANLPLIRTFEVEGDSAKHSFRHDGTGLIVSVGFTFDEDQSKYKLHVIRVAIRVSDKEETEVFTAVDSSEARTQYRKGWNLAVTKNVSFEDVVYMFTLRCWDSAGKRPYL